MEPLSPAPNYTSPLPNFKMSTNMSISAINSSSKPVAMKSSTNNEALSQAPIYTSPVHNAKISTNLSEPVINSLIENSPMKSLTTKLDVSVVSGAVEIDDKVTVDEMKIQTMYKMVGPLLKYK